jgi:hypothetical protein
MKTWCATLLLLLATRASGEPFDAWAFHVKHQSDKALQNTLWIDTQVNPALLLKTSLAPAMPIDELYLFEVHYRHEWAKHVTLKPQILFIDYQDPAITTAESVTVLLSTEISF